MGEIKNKKLAIALSSVLSTTAGLAFADEQQSIPTIDLQSSNVVLTQVSGSGAAIEEYVVRPSREATQEPKVRSISWSEWNANKGQETEPPISTHFSAVSVRAPQEEKERGLKGKLEGLVDNLPGGTATQTTLKTLGGRQDLLIKGLRTDPGNRGVNYEADINHIPFFGKVEGLKFEASYGEDTDDNQATFTWEIEM